jgi:1-acyl-sn-glycerol-3-phosphate acyltransferase
MKNDYYVKTHRILWPLVHLLHPVEAKGVENLPSDQPVLLCANHSSWWDPILLISALDQAYPLRIMGKMQLFKIPVLKTFLTNLGVFPVDRGNSDIGALKKSIGSLKEGWNLLLFPEGTRVKKGKTVTVKAGAAMIAIRAGVKLLPVYIGTKKPLFRKVPMVFGKPYAPVYTGRKGTAEEYQANADEIMRQVYELGASK